MSGEPGGSNAPIRLTVRRLLDGAHAKLQGGDATSALEAVISALKLLGGNGAVMPVLQRAREEFQATQVLHDQQVNGLSRLFAEISLEAEKRMLGFERAVGQDAEMDDASTISTSSQLSRGVAGSEGLAGASDPILAETGREGLTECALADGSSYMCAQCGAIVQCTRRQAHQQYWCDA